MREEQGATRGNGMDERLWQKIELVYRNCGPNSPEWGKVIALIAAAQLAERELAYQIVNGRLRFTCPN